MRAAAKGTGDDAEDTEDAVELLCCWPIVRSLPADWSLPGWTVAVGQLPGDPELVVSWRHDQPIPAVPGAVDPAVLALLATAEERGVDPNLSRLRQIGLLDNGEPVGVEVAVPLAQP